MSSVMSTIDTQKKPAPTDWTTAYIVYRLRLRGLSLRKLSREHGYCPSSASNALYFPWPKMERLIAHALGVTPQEIWPSRYNEDGTPNRSMGRPRVSDHTCTIGRRNVEAKGAA